MHARAPRARAPVMDPAFTTKAQVSMIAKPSIQPVALWSPTVLSMTIEIIDMTSSSWIVVSPSASLQRARARQQGPQAHLFFTDTMSPHTYTPGQRVETRHLASGLIICVSAICPIPAGIRCRLRTS